jgi:DNA-binding transcriptional ArsR family regulator
MEKLKRSALEIVAGRFKLLSSATRLQILQYICEKERTVTELGELTGQKQANLSKQLGLLHRAGLIRRRVDGIHVYYRTADDSLISICQHMRKVVVDSQREMASSLSGGEEKRPGH